MTISISSNANQVIAELGAIGRTATVRAGRLVRDAGQDMRDEWRGNARETARKHGRRYPNAIKATMVDPLTSRIYPDTDMPQGGMSFEFGSTNQPPHLDGQRALDALAPRIERRFDQILTF